MKSPLFTGLLILSISLSATAQKAPIKFGDVSMEELKMVRYDKDTSAAAVILVDFGESSLEYDPAKGYFVIRFERLKRIKIFKKDGYSLANESIMLYHSGNDAEKISSIKGVTYNLDGNKMVESKMKNDAVFKEEYDNNFTITKFTLPNVKEGSVLEVSYKTESEFIFNFQDWDFQSTFPTVWSEYRTRIPEYYTYDQFMQGYVTPTINERSSIQRELAITERNVSATPGYGATQGRFSTDKVQYNEIYGRFVTQDVPAFKEEPFMNNNSDYISKLNFELVSQQFPNSVRKFYRGTWENLNKQLLESDAFGKLVKGSGHLNKIVEEVIAGVTDPKEKVAKIYSYVKSNVEWNGNYRKYCDGNFKDALEKKKGSSADINLILVSMLKKAEITADPVIISTRNHGFVRESFPISSQFNYVIASVLVEGKSVLLDATDRTLPMGVIPERCLNGNGYIISESRPGWINLAPNFKSRTTTSVVMTLTPGGELDGKITMTKDGYFAQKMRKQYVGKGKDAFISDLTSMYQWNVVNSSFENVDKINEPVKELYEVKIAEKTQATGDIIYMNPLIKDQIVENPFKSETRIYPVDFGSPTEQMFIGKYVLPAGYAIEELPKPKLIVLPNNGGKFLYSASPTPDGIQVTSQVVINQALFAQYEYAALKEFYNQVVAKQAEQIVIKKK